MLRGTTSGIGRASETGRVAHIVEACFHRTETFIYDLVSCPQRFESWCLTGRVHNETEFPFPRIRFYEVQWDGRRAWDLVDRALWKFWPDHGLPARRSMREIQPSLLHAHFGPAGCLALALASRYGVPLLTSFYGYDASSLPQQAGWLPRLQRLFAQGTAFTAEGPAMRARMVSLGCPEEKIHILPLINYPERYHFQPRRLDPAHPLRILFVGRFAEKKGLPVLLRALAKARSKLAPFELFVIGGGGNESAMRNLAEELEMSSSVSFLGLQPRPVVLAHLANAHLLAVPSLTASDGDTEGGAPAILLEAQASGLPIVTTTHADIPFVVAPAYQEFLAQEGSVDDFASKMVALWEANGRWPDLGHQGRAHVEQQHGIGYGTRLADLYEEVILAEKRNSVRPAL